MSAHHSSLPRPHGSQYLLPLYVDDSVQRSALLAEAATRHPLLISSAAAANAVMLAAAYFTPLQGFMNRRDALCVAESMRLPSGLLWPVPVLNLVTDRQTLREGERIALLDPNRAGHPVLAVQTVEAVETLSDDDVHKILMGIFGTCDANHPGVEAFLAQGRICLSGPIEVLNYSYFDLEFPETFLTARDIRERILERGWQRTVAFQTRNPMHRAHEELCKMALQQVNADGLVIHMLLGRLKPGDIPAPVRDAAIRKMVEKYFAEGCALVCGYGFDMLYAGPREAVLHAIFRQNAGCSHFIIGRDHAGVGDYYGAFDAQAIFDRAVREDDLEIQIFRADHTAWSKKLGRVVMMRDVPDHSPEDFVLLSGTKVRDMLSRGEMLPEEFARPEVAQILMDYYRSTASS